tara:strand:+ start:1556 stop:2509 length:954 start_codon:yes stop_codon:yes gene_type:complete
MIFFIFYDSFGYEASNLSDLKTSQINLFPNDTKASSLLKNLEYVSGLELNSNHEDFGGLSGLIIEDNNNFTTIGDQGIWMTGQLILNNNDELTSISNAKLGYLKNEKNIYLVQSGKLFTDAEAVELFNGKLIVSFERNHRILSYEKIEGVSQLFYDKIKLLDLPNNGGIEAMTSLKDNSLIFISEDLVDSNDRIVGFRLYENKLSKIFVKKNGSFKPTDLSVLPSGDILMLERSFTPIKGAKARISLIKYQDIIESPLITPIYIDTISPPMIVDNFEGISSIKSNSGGYFIFILSDDNFNFLQKTILLQFHWDGSLN